MSPRKKLENIDSFVEASATKETSDTEVASTASVSDKTNDYCLEKLEDFVRGMPKVELHLHLEGTMEPELLFQLAQRHHITIPYATVDELRQAYDFSCLQDFLDLYYQGMEVLKDPQDFYDLAWAYLQRVNAEHVRHVEVFFDPQPHMDRGVSFETVVTGFSQALQHAEREWGLTSQLIMCFVRHLPVEHAVKTLEASRPFRHLIAAVGLDSSEKDHPPKDFEELFAQARAMGYKCVAHAGEEGPASWVTSALDDLKVSRVDHGVRSMEDPKLIQRLAKEQVPLTVCPLSNCKLCVFPTMAQHNLGQMMQCGVCVTINSDDPAYFGGYLTANFLACVREPALQLGQAEVIQLVRNSIAATFLDDKDKKKLEHELDTYVQAFDERWAAKVKQEESRVELEIDAAGVAATSVTVVGE